MKAGLIDLVWDGPPDAWYIRGHVSDDEAIAAVRFDFDDEDEEEEPTALAVAYQAFARWQWPRAEQEEPPGNGYVLEECEPGPGAFKVTVVRRSAAIERDRAYQQERKEQPARAVAAFVALFPEATDVQWQTYRVVARLACCEFTVEWQEEKPDLLCSTMADNYKLLKWLGTRREVQT